MAVMGIHKLGKEVGDEGSAGEITVFGRTKINETKLNSKFIRAAMTRGQSSA